MDARDAICRRLLNNPNTYSRPGKSYQKQALSITEKLNIRNIETAPNKPAVVARDVFTMVKIEMGKN